MKKRIPLTNEMKEAIYNQLVDYLHQHEQLFSQQKCRITCFYIKRKNNKKLFAYINPKKYEVIVGFSHYGTKILSTFPVLKSMAHEVKESMLKFTLYTIEDIQTLAIPKLIEFLLSTYQE